MGTVEPSGPVTKRSDAGNAPFMAAISTWKGEGGKKASKAQEMVGEGGRGEGEGGAMTAHEKESTHDRGACGHHSRGADDSSDGGGDVRACAGQGGGGRDEVWLKM